MPFLISCLLPLCGLMHQVVDTVSDAVNYILTRELPWKGYCFPMELGQHGFSLIELSSCEVNFEINSQYYLRELVNVFGVLYDILL